MYATMNTTGMNSTENMNSFLDDTYKFWDEAMAENPYWLLFMVLLMCVFYPIAFFMVICNVWKLVAEEEDRDEGYDSIQEEDEINEEEF